MSRTRQETGHHITTRWRMCAHINICIQNSQQSVSISTVLQQQSMVTTNIPIISKFRDRMNDDVHLLYTWVISRECEVCPLLKIFRIHIDYKFITRQWHNSTMVRFNFSLFNISYGVRRITYYYYDIEHYEYCEFLQMIFGGFSSFGRPPAQWLLLIAIKT